MWYLVAPLTPYPDMLMVSLLVAVSLARSKVTLAGVAGGEFASARGGGD